ncbi:type 1 fimbrial protein [Ralstonia mannitolilytica]|uniref:fimbrial protein n=1 Tax=Ralstonia TaxID=48736 RepID=UPI000C7DA967|nr:MULTISPECIES: fimbrial protein [Ralstonia]MBU9579741.1 type 1 fimbrial protein [Ralstonia mannitolilytica]PLT16169.1 fimbrial protein [Ralstonia mannitolilytica]
MRATYVGFATGLMLIPAQGAFAYTCETVTSSTTVQPKDLTIQRGLPVGSVIAEVASDLVSTFKCSNTEPRLPWQEVGIKAYGTYVADFDGKRIYKTNVEGIGYAVGITAGSDDKWEKCANLMRWVNGSETDNPNHYMYCSVNGMFSALPRQGKALIRFYKTAQSISAGWVSGRQVGSFILRNNKTLWHTPESTINIGSFKVDVMSCTVSNTLIPVKLGDVPISAFKGPGTSPPSRTKAFSIPLNCAKGTSINLQLDGAAHDAAQGMLKLDAGSTSATGVAIQLLYDDKPIELAKRFKWQVADADGDYAIPLKARYVQTANSVTTGIANGSATFTLTYQ